MIHKSASFKDFLCRSIDDILFRTFSTGTLTIFFSLTMFFSGARARTRGGWGTARRPPRLETSRRGTPWTSRSQQVRLYCLHDQHDPRPLAGLVVLLGSRIFSHTSRSYRKTRLEFDHEFDHHFATSSTLVRSPLSYSQCSALSQTGGIIHSDEDMAALQRAVEEAQTKAATAEQATLDPKP